MPGSALSAWSECQERYPGARDVSPGFRGLTRSSPHSRRDSVLVCDSTAFSGSKRSQCQAMRPSGRSCGKRLVADRACVHKGLVGQAKELGFDATATGVSGKDLSRVVMGAESGSTEGGQTVCLQETLHLTRSLPLVLGELVAPAVCGLVWLAVQKGLALFLAAPTRIHYRFAKFFKIQCYS